MAVLRGNIKARRPGGAASGLRLAVGWGYMQVRAAADDRAEYRIVNDEYSQVLAPTRRPGWTRPLQLKAGSRCTGCACCLPPTSGWHRGSYRAASGRRGPAGGHRRLQPDRTAGQYILRAGVLISPTPPPEDGAYTLHMSVAPHNGGPGGPALQPEGGGGFALAQADGQALDATAALQYMTDYTGHWPSKGFLLIGLLCTLGIVGAAKALLWWGKDAPPARRVLPGRGRAWNHICAGHAAAGRRISINPLCGRMLAASRRWASRITTMRAACGCGTAMSRM